METDFVGLKVTLITSAVGVAVVMPSFFVAASGVLMRADLGFDRAGLGLAVSIFFGMSAASSAVGGRWAERLGAGRALVFVTVGTAFALLLIAAIAENFTHLIVVLALGGVLNGIAQPAASLALARNVRYRQGLMFGVKQSAVPASSLVAGASVPLVGSAFGWRATFVLGGLLAAFVASLIPLRLAPPTHRVRVGRGMREGDASIAPLIMLAIAAGVGTSAAITLPVFLVESAVERGVSLRTAGWVLVAASSASVAGRLISGWWADYRQGALYLVPLMLLIGGVGYALLAFGGPVLFIAGGLVAYAFGWGWTGLLMYAIVRLNPNAPGAATGIVLTGAAAGAAGGPFAFGIAVTRLGFVAAWAIAGLASVVAAGLLFAARLWLLRDRLLENACS